ncbi:hypothetical protein BZA05DRAFT_424676 [Tricharina praecox]|uniref:uncharacterized protein n=1 Tax=Tricharina praecox TaxID=43433 RepID=UPI00221F367D|nr:uncharacterized protein BZA05DRAFT_424676 [Tricharina praecox]KAI5855477.1 hypothetical protein BZA05DRAFT_424676 [Tricharina praecox]
MTLKEQTASIDRLQKENFDLKIKVYYLNEKLEKQSDEGVKEALQENVDMKVKLAEGMRERKALKKRIRELERKVEELGGEKQREEEASAAAESEEIWELRERIEKYEVEIEGYRRRDTEKTERMREFRRQTTNGHQANEELLEQMRDLLNSETARREAADAENLRLRDEVYRMRAHDHATPLSRATSRSERSQSRSGGADNAAVTQLSQVRRENEDLRREVTAQTSMLTSRNREKERLYAEIEDLKICMRNGGQAPAFESASRAPSVFSERLAERSGSRSGGVASSASTHVSTVTESEREDFENTNGALRDRISELRLKNQDLEQQIEEVFQELEHRREELDATGEELDMANAELQEMQNERDEALQQREEIELDFDQLKEEAEEELRRLEDEVDLRGNEILRLEDEIRIKEEDFSAMQRELRNVSDSVVRFEDAQEIHQGEIRRYEERIQDLERTIHENEQEMNVLENTLRENNEKIERLTVQGESAKGEIAFLREEQDGDKILIGELQSKIKQLDAAIEDERDKVRDARAQIDSERNQREQHGDLRQQEWERRLNEKSQELTATKDEIRRLKSKVCNREDEAKTWRERLEDLERGLREALGDLGGTRAGLMQSVLNLQNDLDATLEDLDQARNELTEKDRNLKDRENLLESMALESRKLTDLLEKERSQRGRDKNALEVLQSTTTQDSRRISQHQRQTEVLEKQRQKEAKSLKHLEDQFKEQIAERNNLLLQVWQRLSAVCGADWSSRNSHVITPSPSGVDDGKLSMDTAIISAFPGFTRNLMIAVKTIESIVAGFKTKCRGVERDLWKEYQVVENAVEQRTRRIERLEGLIRNGMGEGSEKIRTELAKLRTENRMLKAEVGTLKTENTAHSATNPSIAISPPTKRDRSSRTHTHSHTSTSHSAAPAEHKEKATEKAPEKDSLKEPSKQRSSSSSSSQKDKPLAVVRTDTPPTATATSKSTSSTSTSNPAATTTGATGSSTAEGGSGGSGSGSGAGGEKRWILRLRELEKRLKQEREARLLDRSMANKKIQETRGEREEMRRELERERVRGNSAMSGRSS